VGGEISAGDLGDFLTADFADYTDYFWCRISRRTPETFVTQNSKLKPHPRPKSIVLVRRRLGV
jgi:hypothetical protein